MAEYVIVRQNSQFETEFQASDPHQPESDEVRPVDRIHEMTPYTMLLAGLAACTAMVVNTYARNYKIALQSVELSVRYSRDFQEDCENCEGTERYEVAVIESIRFTGDLSEADRQKLLRIAHQCPIHKMLETGIPIHSQLR